MAFISYLSWRNLQAWWQRSITKVHIDDSYQGRKNQICFSAKWYLVRSIHKIQRASQYFCCLLGSLKSQEHLCRDPGLIAGDSLLTIKEATQEVGNLKYAPSVSLGQRGTEGNVSILDLSIHQLWACLLSSKIRVRTGWKNTGVKVSKLYRGLNFCMLLMFYWRILLHLEAEQVDVKN